MRLYRGYIISNAATFVDAYGYCMALDRANKSLQVNLMHVLLSIITHRGVIDTLFGY